MPNGLPNPQPPRRRSRRRLDLVSLVLAVLFATSAGYGAVSVTYNTSSEHNVSLRAPPVVWASGPDSSGNDFVASFSLSSNATFYTITLKPVPEANVTWGNLTTLHNQDSVARTVTVTGNSVSGLAKVLDARMEFRSYGTDALVATMNFKDASPTAALGSMAAGARMHAKLYVKLDTGTGSGDLPSSLTATLTVS